MSQTPVPHLIAKKRDGEELTIPELDQFIKGVVNKEIQDSQLGAMLMAIYMSGMTLGETIHLCSAMTDSGERLKWPEEWRGLVADKHSTGGVGDKVSIVLAPALAACGLKIPMISGRGLGHAGGTLDKLESIPGFCVSQPLSSMQRIMSKVGCCIVGQTGALVPADRIMYATRDVTATVESIPLITASIVSKKAAEDISALVLDVKFGKGAYMKEERDARELAKTLVSVSNGMGVVTTAVLSNMNQPLGRAIGNSLEIAESIECLHGKGPEDLVNLTCVLGGHLLRSVGRANTADEGTDKIRRSLNDGSALAKFREMMVAQGVTEETATKLCTPAYNLFTVLPKSQRTTDIKAKSDGYVHGIDAMACALVAGGLGAGRSKAGQEIDLAVGLKLHVDVGSKINKGEKWVTVHHTGELSEQFVTDLQNGVDIQNKTCSKVRVVEDIITS